MSKAGRWWRDYDRECLAWWWTVAPTLSATATVAFLIARFGGPHNRGQPVCAITPSEYVHPDACRGAIDIGQLYALVGPDA